MVVNYYFNARCHNFINCRQTCDWPIQGVREWSPKNFRVSLSGKTWAKTFIRFLDKLNRFLKIKLFPAVLGLLKYCFVHEQKSNKFRLKVDSSCKKPLVVCNSIFFIFLDQIKAQRDQKIIVWVEYFPYK
jgi:hypothetical protein